MVTSGVDDIVRAHHAFGPLEEVIERRRAIYHGALELAGAPPQEDGVVDNPAVRAHLGEVLGGRAVFDPTRLRHVETLADRQVVDIRGRQLRFAAAEEANNELAGALARVGRALDGRSWAQVPPTMLVGRSSRARDARVTVLAGVELAVAVLPEITVDLLSHIALVAVLNGETAGGLGSASLREYPGLLLLPEPQTVVEVAEAVVHEAAHQLFFDLAQTNALLGIDHVDAERFAPPWNGPNRPVWPFEQAVAAFHAYTCLAALAGRLPASHVGELSDVSLLPTAADRAVQVGRWLERQRSRLGPAGSRFVRLLSATQDDHADQTMPSRSVDALVADIRAGGGPLVVRLCGDWALVIGMTGTHPDLYWLPASAAGRI